MTSNELLQIFYSGYDVGPNWMVLDDLEALIGEGAISVGKKKLTTVDEYRRYLDDESVFAEGPGPQGKGHAALKEIGAKFLVDNGFSPTFEVYFNGLHPDIMDKAKKVIIECGTTDPASVLIFFEDSNVSWVGVIPYPLEGEKEIYLYKFSKRPGFSKYAEIKLTRLRNAFAKTGKWNSTPLLWDVAKIFLTSGLPRSSFPHVYTD